MLKGLPLTYNKDLQEDKEGVFDAADTIEVLVPVFRTLLGTLHVRRDRAARLLEGGFLEALSVADYLTAKGVPFRDAYAVAGQAVRRAEELGKRLPEVPLGEYRALHAAFAKDLYESLTIERALEQKSVVGGTAPARVREEIDRVRKRVRVGS